MGKLIKKKILNNYKFKNIISKNIELFHIKKAKNYILIRYFLTVLANFSENNHGVGR